MDQAFSVKNLEILLKEDRSKGGALEEKYIPEALKIRKKIQKTKKHKIYYALKLRLGKIAKDVYAKRVAVLDNILETRTVEHKNCVVAELERICEIVNKKEFRINVNVLPSTIGGKKVYGVGHTLDEILATRLIQKILREVYEIRMPSRDILVSQVKSLALDGVPKYIIRADIEKFFESVRHKDLLDEIHQTPELSIVVKRILTRLIKDYVAASGDNKGLPRGIGISAYLSEIYLSNIDKEIRAQADLFYYARYVDDMVLMYAPKRKASVSSYMSNLVETLKKRGLVLNSKTTDLDVTEEQKGKIEYLGYEFDLAPGSRGVRLSHKKVQKYKLRIEKSFTDYAKKAVFISDKAGEELMMRSLFLTGNMRLFSRKSNAFIGVYFSNKYITETNQLKGLDYFFQNKIKGVASEKLKRKLSKLSFEKGFSERVFRNFDARTLAELSRGWNHG